MDISFLCEKQIIEKIFEEIQHIQKGHSLESSVVVFLTVLLVIGEVFLFILLDASSKCIKTAEKFIKEKIPSKIAKATIESLRASAKVSERGISHNALVKIGILCIIKEELDCLLRDDAERYADYYPLRYYSSVFLAIGGLIFALIIFIFFIVFKPFVKDFFNEHSLTLTSIISLSILLGFNILFTIYWTRMDWRVFRQMRRCWKLCDKLDYPMF